MLVALLVPGRMPRKPTESLNSARPGLLSRLPPQPAKSPKGGAKRLSLCRHAEEHGPASGRRVNLTDLGLNAGQADAESFDLAQPALLLCLSNAVNEVVADLDQIERDILESAS
ncbi:hypothetical protein [Streptomyces phaeochromogenes]